MTTVDKSRFFPVLFDEVAGHLQLIKEHLLILDQGQLDNDGLSLVRRSAHSIKGSAQMLGVIDLGQAGELLEDVFNFVIKQELNWRSPMVALLHQLHDAIEERLTYLDAKAHLDVALFRKQFQEIAESVERESEHQRVNRQRLAKRRVQRKHAISSDLLKTIQSSIQSSMQDTDKPDAAVRHRAPSNSGHVEYRPEDSSKAGVADTSGSATHNPRYMQVDQPRLLDLSDQFTVLGSDHYGMATSSTSLLNVTTNINKLSKQLQGMHAGDPQSATALATIQRGLDQQIRLLQRLTVENQRQEQRAMTQLDDMRDQLFTLRKRPMEYVLSRIPDLLQRLATEHGGNFQLLLSGEAVELDQLVADALAEPLEHLLTNAVVHAIEEPAERLKQSKPAQGQITLSARQQGNRVVIDVIDDGCGLDGAAIRDRAIDRGLCSKGDVEGMTEKMLQELIFLPGFSTRTNIGDAPGMGMNTVLDAIREMTGSIRLDSELGKGTRMRLSVPAISGIHDVTVFSIAGQRFAMAEHLIEQVLILEDQEINYATGAYASGYIDYDQHRVALIDLRPSLGRATEALDDDVRLLLIAHLGSHLGLIVDDVFDTRQVMVRKLDPYLKHYQPVCLMGCTVVRDGSVLLLLESGGLKEMWRKTPAINIDLLSELEPAYTGKQLLLVDDSCMARHIEKKLFEALGFAVDTAIGSSNMFEKIGLKSYDLLVIAMEPDQPECISMQKYMRAEDRLKQTSILILSARMPVTDSSPPHTTDAATTVYKHELAHDLNPFLQTLAGMLNPDD